MNKKVENEELQKESNNIEWKKNDISEEAQKNGMNEDYQDNDSENQNDGSGKGQWAYTRSGKRVRGLLCMLTFFVFMIFVGLIYFVIMNYGVRILTDSNYHFHDSNEYKNELRNEAGEILNYAISLDENKGTYTFSIVDVEKCVVNLYNYEKIPKGELELELEVTDVDNPEIIKDYVISSTKLTDNFYDYDYAVSIIRGMDENSFLYFSNEAFTRIFIQNGVVNTGHRFSGNFSESSYFIYRDPRIMEILRETNEKMSDGNGTEAAELDGKTKDGDEAHFTVSFNLDEDELIAEQSRIFDETGIRLSDAEYAVYDPEYAVFYSTWDDYFTENANYIYVASQVEEYIDNSELTGEGVSSIIFPLLWSENRSDILRIVDEAYVNPEEFERLLQEKTGSSFYYYARLNGDVYSNVSSCENVAALDSSYRVGGEDSGLPEPSCGLNELFQSENLIENLKGYDPEGYMYFGVDPEAVQLEDESSSAQFTWGYEKVAKHLIFVIVCGVIIFAVLMWQAWGLIKTTGRDGSGNKERIELNKFDVLYTELWFIAYVGIIVAAVKLARLICVFAGNIMLKYFGDRSSACQLYYILVAAFFSVIAGFSFMELTLSFARRIKARNIRKRLFSRVIAGELKQWIKSKKSADKLKMITAFYIGIQVIVLVVIEVLVFSNVKNPGFPVLVLCVFMLIIWACLAWFIKGVAEDLNELKKGIAEITDGNFEQKVVLKRRRSMFRDLAGGINHISDGLKNAVETSLKDERMKTELITNVSHDLKTPLTSIINYINLLKSENMPTPEARHYVEVLDSKAHRLSQLTEDLVEAAKATSGNIELDMMPLSFEELMKQALGEFEDKFIEKNLTVVTEYPSSQVMVLADGRRLFRILDNILQNAYKYAMEGTRIYIDLTNDNGQVCLVMKNISRAQLGISADELMERFTRGDSSRTTEGSGLGLSIAKDLAKLMGGNFELELDGDLFKVILVFPEYFQGDSEPNIPYKETEKNDNKNESKG